jgi:hypothetical protein
MCYIWSTALCGAGNFVEKNRKIGEILKYGAGEGWRGSVRTYV